MKEFPAAITALEGVKLVKNIFETSLNFKIHSLLYEVYCPGQLGHGSLGSVLALSCFLKSDSYPQLPQHFSVTTHAKCKG